MTDGGTLELLRRFESQNVTFLAEDGAWPMVWDRAKGVHVWDDKGKKHLDLTAAFGVAAAGHANRAVVRAGQKQLAQLPHAMGDVHPHARKAELARELSRITFERWEAGPGKVIFGSSGFEAVEAALKTAMLRTGKWHVVAFQGAYHGVGYGALSTTHREHFRSPFRRQLSEFGRFVPFPLTEAELAEMEFLLMHTMLEEPIGAIIVEPVQVRGGIRIPPPGFLPLLREVCDAHKALLIVDEIYTGFGRTGAWFGCEQRQTVPDLICLGKALTGGFPLSACVGRAELMDAAWPLSTGEAIHTSTFLGNPVGCAMALAQIKEIEARKLPEAGRDKGKFLLKQLGAVARKNKGPLRLSARGLGLLAGLEMTHGDGSPATEETFELLKRLLQRGFIFIPEGEHANVIGFTPPLTITKAQLRSSIKALAEEIAKL